MQTSYQLGKYMKHTVVDPRYNIQSVFASASTQAYESYIINSAVSGSVEFDGFNRKNIVWVAGSPVGFQFQDGRLVHPQDSVKVVLSTDTGKVHAFPQSSTQFLTATCPDCGGPAIY